MGGGDLNTKKSWHPNTMKNQERVWKAEQQDAAEKRKLSELQREIHEERNREELKSIAKKSGILPNDEDGDKKLEWMYRGPSQLVNREEYLLGRTIDKTFEQLDAQEQAEQPTVGVKQPKNHVEHECIPFSIRQFKGVQNLDQVDIARKLMEDPLMAIKQKEAESRQKILQNPVKLKELHRLLKSDRSLSDKGKSTRRKEKKSKKSKKSKKAKKGTRSDGSNGASGSDDNQKDLDRLLTEKYKKVQNSIGDDRRQEVSLDKLLTMKYEKLSKQLKTIGKSKRSSKRKHRSSSDDSSSESSEDEDPRRRPSRKDGDKRVGPSKRRSRSPSVERRHRSKRSQSNESRRRIARKETTQSSSRRRDRSQTPPKIERKKDERSSKRDRSAEKKRSSDKRRERSRSKSPRKDTAKDRRRERKPSSSDSSSSSEEATAARPSGHDSDDEHRSRKARNFGLVSAAGEKIELSKRTEVRMYKREEIKAQQSKQKPTWSKPVEKKRVLTEAELEERLKAMRDNANWRDRERESNVRRYKDEENHEDAKNNQHEFDQDFLTKQFKHAAANETVESRIKSNRNNIQRSGGAMNTNFAKR